jgi:prepilin-type N-terminal cleavage/methylation domain-containing protein
MTRRRGYTLIEMMMAMFIVATILVLGTALVERLLTLDDAAKAHVEALETASRLARTFRDDARSAASAEESADPPRLVLRRPDGRVVEYALDGKTLARVVRDGARTLQAEAIRLPSRRVELEVERRGGRTAVALTFDRRAGTRGEPSPLRIEAAVGLDRRFDGGAKP